MLELIEQNPLLPVVYHSILSSCLFLVLSKADSLLECLLNQVWKFRPCIINTCCGVGWKLWTWSAQFSRDFIKNNEKSKRLQPILKLRLQERERERERDCSTGSFGFSLGLNLRGTHFSQQTKQLRAGVSLVAAKRRRKTRLKLCGSRLLNKMIV